MRSGHIRFDLVDKAGDGAGQIEVTIAGAYHHVRVEGGIDAVFARDGAVTHSEARLSPLRLRRLQTVITTIQQCQSILFVRRHIHHMLHGRSRGGISVERNLRHSVHLRRPSRTRRLGRQPRILLQHEGRIARRSVQFNRNGHLRQHLSRIRKGGNYLPRTPQVPRRIRTQFAHGIPNPIVLGRNPGVHSRERIECTPQPRTDDANLHILPGGIAHANQWPAAIALTRVHTNAVGAHHVINNVPRIAHGITIVLPRAILAVGIGEGGDVDAPKGGGGGARVAFVGDSPSHDGECFLGHGDIASIVNPDRRDGGCSVQLGQGKVVHDNIAIARMSLVLFHNQMIVRRVAVSIVSAHVDRVKVPTAMASRQDYIGGD
mmetsp:Transcript_31716/g.66697  ORF Transcript_31716/g.66697 Transcript_31716/m.66697 type:complete len:375 (+) Transcript_31716:670-1794(+)